MPPRTDLFGLVKRVDTAQRTITLSIEKAADKAQKTFAVAKDATILLEEPGQLADLAAGSRVALMFDADGQTVAEIRTEPFRIVVTPQTKPIEVNKHFDVELRVVNASELPQSFYVMTCSWFTQWQSSNSGITPGIWYCSMNGPAPVKLAPRETYTPKKFAPRNYLLWMQAEAVGLISFRMGFTPVQDKPGFRGRPGKRTYWSSERTIKVNENQGKQ